MSRWPQSLCERMFNRITIDPGTGCWEWGGKGHDPKGYGRVYVAGRLQKPHRVSYVMFKGPIDAGLVIDHLCRNTRCVNPDHLEPVTTAENTRRGWPAQKTHCVNGHQYDSENTYIRPTGQRDCRACIRDRVRRYLECEGGCMTDPVLPIAPDPNAARVESWGAAEYELERQQEQLDRLWEHGDMPHVFGPLVQDVPRSAHDERQNTPGPLVGGSRTAPPAADVLLHVTAGGAQAPTNSKQPRRAHARAA